MNVQESYSRALEQGSLSSPSVDHRGMLMNSAAPLNHVRRCDVGAVINGLWRGGRGGGKCRAAQRDRQEVGKGSNAVKRGPKCRMTVQGSAKRSADFVKQQPGRARQYS